ncbi:MAG: M20/M25/M40 family metallo-hydrolase [Planctomycetota bacterium]
MREAFALAPFALAALAPFAPFPAAGEGEESGFAGGFASIAVQDLRVHLAEIASPAREGRDTPSAGQRAAADYLIARLAEAGFAGAGPDGAFRLSFPRTLTAPDPTGTSLVLSVPGAEPAPLALDVDFVPVPGCAGEAEGPIAFAGFGITDSGESYDDLRGRKLDGRIVVILEGEPRHPRLFDGLALTPVADLYRKLEKLEDAGAAAVLVVRRPPAEEAVGRDGAPIPAPPLGYRYGWASWNQDTTSPLPRRKRAQAFPAAEVTPAAASRLLGEDVLALAARIDRAGRPLAWEPGEERAALSCAFAAVPVAIDNVVGVLSGRDPGLAGEYVVIGAHYDHVGIDPWGRIGCGADDNGSGTGALLEVAEALAQAGPRRSILACAFAGEEDGLWGSEAFVAAPPVPLSAMVAMLNLDMIGRGDPDEVIVLGVEPNPALGPLLKRAARLKGTRLDRIVVDRAAHLWPRSDHYPFHQHGIPCLFLFEAENESENPDYHTFRDTIDRLDFEKIVRTARLTYNAAWLLATDDDRPPAPRVR